MLRIEHIAIWVNDLEKMKGFYIQYFNATPNEKYTNVVKQFESYFLSFGEGKARIELMRKPGIAPNNMRNNATGLAHFAITVGDEAAVDALTERLRRDGHTVAGNPHAPVTAITKAPYWTRKAITLSLQPDNQSVPH